MVKEYNYVNIREVLSRVMMHPLLHDITLEQAIQYTLDFIGIFGMPELFINKEEEIPIENHAGRLPCDMVSINQVKDKESGICLRSVTDNFFTNGENVPEKTFRTQGQCIFTSFKTGDVIISYKALPIDKEGLPLLIDNAVFLKTLEAYIKKEVFTILFDLGKITASILQNTQQQYAWLAGQMQSEFTIPSISEMESISRMWTTLLQRNTEFDNGFKDLGNREYIKVQ